MSRTGGYLILICAVLLQLTHWTADAHPIGVVSVSGNTFVADGHPWVPRGVNVVGLLAPRAEALPIWGPRLAEASAHWGPAEIAAIKNYGADVVRFLVSQPGLDPRSPLYTPAYASRIVAAVRAARAAGLAVILCMQWERTSGLVGLPSLPDDSTLRAWQVLAPNFATDRGVMYELFNEPFPPPGYRRPRRVAWGIWSAVFQRLINDVRPFTQSHVIIVDGIPRTINVRAAESLSDPAASLAFAVHPYPRDPRNDPEAWDRHFGDVARRYPVILTEWNSTSRWACQPDTPALAQQFLAYLRERRIGVVGFAFDLPGSLVKDFSFAPTTYDDFHCSTAGDNGAGEALRQHFRSLH